MIEILIGQIICYVTFIWIGYYCIKAVNRHWKIIEWNAQQIGKTKRQKGYIFIKDEEKMRCQYCSKPISEQEYQRERQGFCDECSDDLATEEEEEVWGM